MRRPAVVLIAWLVAFSPLAAVGVRASVDDVAKLELSLWNVKDASEQEKLVGPVFDALQTSEEKMAFLELSGPTRYFSLIQQDVYLRYAAKLLHDSDPGIRAQAVAAFSYYDSPVDLDEIEKLADDQAPEVRDAVAFALQAGGMKELPRIKHMIETDKVHEVATSGIDGLGYMAGDVSSAADRATLLTYIETFADRPEFKDVVIAAFGAAKLTDKEAIYLDQLATFITDTDTNVRLEAIATLEEVKSVRETLAIIPALQDQNFPVRLAAIEALGTLQDRRSTSALVGLFDDPQIEVACAAMRAVGQIGDASQAPLIAGLLSNDNSNLRRAAVGALVTLRAVDQYDAVKQLLHDPESMVRCAVTDVLPELYGKGAGAIAASMILDESRSVRQMAEVVLYRINAWDQRATVEQMVEKHAGEHHDDADYLEAARRFIAAAPKNGK